MTEQQIEKTIDDIEEWLWLKTFKNALRWKGTIEWVNDRESGCLPAVLSFPAWWWILLALEKLGWVEMSRAGSVEAYLLALVTPFIFSLAILWLSPAFSAILREAKKPKVARSWELFVGAYTRKHGKLSNEAEKLTSRIRSLYQLDDGHKAEEGYRPDDGPRVLPVKQAARLLHVYEQEQRRVFAVSKSIVEIDCKHNDLTLRLETLKEKGERRKDAEEALEKLSKAKEDLFEAKIQLKVSINNLESIVESAENERDARATHRYIDRAIEETNLAQPWELTERKILKEIEERITNEIDSYVQIEKKLRQDCDNVLAEDKSLSFQAKSLEQEELI